MTARLAQVQLLRRAFFTRLLESDLLPPGLPQVQLIIWSVAALAMPAIAVPMMLSPRYAALAGTAALGPAIALDRLLLVTIAFAVMGLVALAIWDGVIPDARDARILSPLPIAVTVFVAARLGAIGTMFLLFAGGTSIVPNVAQCVMATGFQETPGFFASVAAQLIAVLAAGAFGFFSLVFLQCALFVLFGRQAVQRMSVALQIAFAFVLLQLLWLVPWFSGLSPAGGAAPAVRAFMPPLWFFALFDHLAGGYVGTPGTLAVRAVAATAFVVVGTVVLYAGSYRHMLRQALEAPPATRRRPAVTMALRRAPEWLIGAPVERAVCGFTLRTLARSRQHRLLLAVYVAVGLALSLLGVLPALRGGREEILRPGPTLGHVVFVMLFVVLGGMRSLFSIPIQPGANWAVRACEPADRPAVMRGVRRAMLVAGVAPLVLASLVLTAAAWDAVVALRHAVFAALMGTLLVELLLWRFCKMPFTCTYLPGRSHFRTRWPALVFAFSWYAYSVPILEFGLLRTPLRVAIAELAIVATIAGVGALRDRELRAESGLAFAESDPEALFEGFKLSEGLAGNAH